MTQPLARPQRLTLRGFSKERAALVREMEDHGWTGRITSNGHAFMRAPDGQTTCSVSPKFGSPTRATGNSQAVFKRWRRQQETDTPSLTLLTNARIVGLTQRSRPRQTGPAPCGS